MRVFALENEDITELEQQTGADKGLIRPIPLNDAVRYGMNKLNVFMVKYGMYCFPTHELIDYLRTKINNRPAIEIGCGLGIIGRELGIPITDSKLQSEPHIQKYYELMGNTPVIKYPKDVRKMEALKAVRKYKPRVVIGSYITHKWRYDMMSGNADGVDTLKLVRMAPEYYMIGNLQTHRDDPAMKYLDGIETHEFVITRGDNIGSVIFRWKR